MHTYILPIHAPLLFRIYFLPLMATVEDSITVRSLPPPQPKSPPVYPDLYAKRRELAKVQMMEREIGFLEEELKSVESLHHASRCCKEITEFMDANSDPFVPTNQTTRSSFRFWKWLCGGSSCFTVSWACCFGCCPLKMPRCCTCECKLCSCSCRIPKCSCCSCPKFQCFKNCCRIPKCNCCSCPKFECFKNCCRIPKCNCCRIPKCNCCMIPKCNCCMIPKCNCCVLECPSCPDFSCTNKKCCFPKFPNLHICSCCTKNCCYSYCLCC